MKTIKKNQLREFTVYELVKVFIALQRHINIDFPNADIRFDFDRSYYKKDDILKIKKMKQFKQNLEFFMTLVQELRSRGISMQEIADLEISRIGEGILTKSYKGSI